MNLGEPDPIQLRARARFAEAVLTLQLPECASAFDPLWRYLELLMEASAIHNLTGVKDPEEAFEVLCLQSLVFAPRLLSCAESCRAPALRVADVGAGAGIPSAPVRLVWRHPRPLMVTAIESRQKKADMLMAMVTEVGIHDYEVIPKRAEEVGRDNEVRDRMDVAVARAVGPLSEVLEYCLPLVRPGGLALIAKSTQQIDEELPAGQVAAKELGAGAPLVELITLGDRVTAMVVVKKERATPKGYPRKAGTPRTHPLGGKPRRA